METKNAKSMTAASTCVCLLAACLLLLARPATAGEIVLYQDDNPSLRGWLEPNTQFVEAMSWRGSGHMARHVWEDGFARMGFRFVAAQIPQTIDWGRARMEFALDPDAQVLRDSRVRLSIGTPGSSQLSDFAAELGNMGDGLGGWRIVSIPMTAFAASRDELLGENGHIRDWYFETTAAAETVIRIDEVRIVGPGLPPAVERPAEAPAPRAEAGDEPSDDPAPARFTSGPAVANGVVRFAVDRSADVTVHILDEQGRVVRHLAAGVLGDNPPSPLAPGLEQAIALDGLDNRGQPLPAGQYRVRVGLNLHAELVQIVGEDPDSYTFVYPRGIAVDEQGEVYLLHRKAMRDSNQQIWVYDRDGRYLREIMPPNPNLHPEYREAQHGSKQADVASAHNRYDTGSLTLMPDGNLYALALDHGFNGAFPGVRRLFRIGTDGGDFRDSTNIAFWHSTHSEQMYMTPGPQAGSLLISDGSLRDQADSEEVRMPSFFVGRPEWRENEALKHAVFYATIDRFGMAAHSGFSYAGTRRLDRPRAWLGTLGEAGDGPEHFNGPRGVAVSAGQEIFVCDSGNNKVKVFRADGHFLREYEQYDLDGASHALANPSVIAFNGDTDEMYLIIDGPSAPQAGKRLIKAVEDEGRLRAIWFVDLHELTGYQIAVDTSQQPVLLWTLFGSGPSTFTRIEDLGATAGSVRHFGGPDQWRGMLPSIDLTVDDSGTMYARGYRRLGTWHYRISPQGELEIADQSFLPRGNGSEPPTSSYENFMRARALAVDEDGNQYMLSMNRTGEGRWDYRRHLEKFSPTGELLNPDCIPEVPQLVHQVEVRRDHGFWLFSGRELTHFNSNGELLWRQTGFRFGHHDYCGCPRARMLVDDNLYSWVGDMGRIGIFVYDRNGNFITRIGRYGNRDCRGAGSDHPEPAIPLDNPRQIVLDDQHLWIQDFNSQRVVQCRLVYGQVEELPWRKD